MSVKLIVYPNPFSDERVESERELGTYRELVGGEQYAASASAVRIVDGERLVENLEERPSDGATIVIRTLPQGGAEEKVTGGTIMAVIGGIALTAATFLTGGLALAAFAGGALLLAGGAALTLRGANMMFDALRDHERSEMEHLPSIRGSRNRMRPYSDIPALIGEHYIVPNLCAKPYTEIAGSDQYLRQLFMVGWGRIDVDDLRVGEDPLENFDEFEWEVAEPGEILSLFADSVLETEVGSLLESGSPVTRTTEGEGTELSVDIFFERGLVRFNDEGKRRNRSVRIVGEYREVGASTWTSWFDKTYTERQARTLRFSKRIVVEKAQYEVRLERITADTDDMQIMDDATWAALRIVNPEEPVSEHIRDRTTRVAIRAKATNQFRGVIDQFNLVGTAHMPVYSGSGSGPAEWSYEPTSNPASAFLFALQGPMAKRVVPDNQIDWEALEAWYERCESEGYRCDAYEDGSRTLHEALNAIAGTGRAVLLRQFGKFSVNEDIPKTPIQVFTPRNSWGFQGSRSMAKPPTRMDISYIDRDAGYQEVEQAVYLDLENPSDDQVQEHTMWGVTGWDQAFKQGRYLLAESMLRREQFQLAVDFEYLVCRLGDWVRVVHDVPLIGVASARVKQVMRNESDEVTHVRIDSTVVMADEQNYALRIRSLSDMPTADLVYAEGEQDLLELETPADIPVDEGDLATVFIAGQEDNEYIVEAIEPRSEFEARLKLVRADPAVYDADTAPIPPYEPNVTLPEDFSLAPLPPSIDEIVADGTVLVKESDGSYTNRIAVFLHARSGRNRPDNWELRWRLQDSEADWDSRLFPGETTELFITPVEDLTTYDVQVRALNDDGRFSQWEGDTVQVLGKHGPPRNVAQVTSRVRSGGIEISWSSVPDMDLSHYKVKEGSDWESGEPLFDGLANSFLWEMKEAGSYNIMVRAVDRSGNMSVAPAEHTVVLEAPNAVENLFATVAGQTVYVSWSMPFSDLPIDRYEIRKGETFGWADLVAETDATYVVVSEAELGEYTYWIAAIDVAGNVGDASDINAIVSELSLSGTDEADVPELEVAGVPGAIQIRFSRQPDLVKHNGFHVQVADYASGPWYEPDIENEDPDNWRKHVEGDYASWPNTFLVHVIQNFDQDSDESGEYPIDTKIWYRARRVNDAGEHSDWSAPVSASAKPLDGAHLALNSITANRLSVGILSAIIAQVTERIEINPEGLFGLAEDRQRKLVIDSEYIRWLEIVDGEEIEVARASDAKDTRPARYTRHIRVGDNEHTLLSGTIAYYSCDDGVPIGEREGGEISLSDSGVQFEQYTRRRARVTNGLMVMGG